MLLIAPLGSDGNSFPRGLRRRRGSLPAPPFIGLTGHVCYRSVTTVFVALMSGFQAAMLMGSACYVLALWLRAGIPNRVMNS